MTTRRELVALLATAPLIATSAPTRAQDQSMIEALFQESMQRLNNPSYVRVQRSVLTYYIELLRIEPPKALNFGAADLQAAIATAARINQEVDKAEAKFDVGAAMLIRSSLVAEYEKRQTILWDYLKQAGITIKSPADVVVERAIVSMLLFYAAATRISNVSQLRFCIFPFNFLCAV
jgi:hypothetical protein